MNRSLNRQQAGEVAKGGHQFRPGDLALLISPLNFGKCVELVSFHDSGVVQHGEGRTLVPDGLRCWLVRGESLNMVLSRSEIVVLAGEGVARESHLIPLRGDTAPERQKEREVAA